jgi:hypothetical protein
VAVGTGNCSHTRSSEYPFGEPVYIRQLKIVLGSNTWSRSLPKMMGRCNIHSTSSKMKPRRLYKKKRERDE